MTPKPRRRETVHSVRLHLECDCGHVETLWVHPDAPLRPVAKAHGWEWIDREWHCPECASAITETVTELTNT
jgi:rubredoxin